MLFGCNTYDITIGRFVTGMGVGSLSMAVPIYKCGPECATGKITF
jgi:hypothetical protein